jgi:hypothetical protein
MRGELQSTFEPQEIRLPGKITARHIKLTALSGFGPDRATALAELAVIYEGRKLTDTDSRSLEYERNRSASPDIDEGDGKLTPEKRIAKPKPKKRGQLG